MISIDRVIEEVIEARGGFKFGSTPKLHYKYGISLQDIIDYRGETVAVDEVRMLSKHEAAEIYKDKYFIKTGIDQLPELIQEVVFDMVLAMGLENAIKIVQTVVHKMGSPIKVDGLLGPRTKQSCVIACNVYGDEVLRAICLTSKDYYRDLVDKDATKAVFLTEWINRAQSYIYA